MEQPELVVHDALHRPHHRSRWAAVVVPALVVGLVLAVAACSNGSGDSAATTVGSPASTAPSSTTPTSTAPATSTPVTSAPAASGSPSTTLGGADLVGDAFYAPPDPLPAGQPGDLLRVRAIPAPTGANGWQIMYLSRSATDQPIAVTGALYAPAAAPNGPRNILAWAHGTTGLGDQCTPSKEAAQQKGNELLLANVALSKGLVFVYTDYEGQGTPGVHTYVVGRSEGRTVLDSIRAAQRFPSAGTTPDSKAVVWGHSQGGGAALWAAELQPSYAPEVAVAGTIAGAPAVELGTLGQRLRTSPFFGYQLMVVAGFHAAYPDLPLGAILTAEGEATVAAVATQCGGEIVDELRGQDPERYFLAGAASSPPWVAALAENSPGTTPTSVPIFIYHGDQDEQIPVDLSATAAERYCASGATVQRTVYPGTNHTGVIAAALVDISRYLDARLAGEAPPSTC